MKTLKAFTSRSLLLVLLINVYSCRQETKQYVSVDPGFTSYISAFTAGFISKQAAIRIRLAEDYPEEISRNQPLNEKLFQISPHVRGSAYWLDQRTIEFRPDENMESGIRYQVNFELEKLMEVPDNLKTFSFEFQTIEQNFTVSQEGLRTYDPKNLRWLYITGTLHAADILAGENLPELLTAGQGSRRLSIRWEHDPEGRIHTFVIDSIERLEKEGLAAISWDGKSIDAKSKGKEEISIPALGDFKLMDISVVQQPEQYVLLKFSDPLKEKQYL
ncbi:MAG: hypothetical protein KAT15_20150, partial [Bacteroidales bacterium]|nr:hypothetical protein [Bacteroidales bacterium]